MAQSGIHAFTGILLSKSLRYKKWLIPSVIFGSILPDIDIVFVILKFTSFDKTFLMHSIFVIAIIYLIFLSLCELTANKNFDIIGKGVCLGMIGHIALDIFWFREVYIFWPLEPSYLLWSYDNEVLINILLSLEFIMFRMYGWFLIKSYINNPSEQGWFITYISKWMKLEFLLFIFSLLSIYLDIVEYKIFFVIMYIPSLVMALISTYILRDVFNHKSINSSVNNA